MKSTLVNITAVLFGITLVASAGVGAVNMITAEPIAQAEQAAKVAALKVVLPPFDQTVPEALTIDDMPITVYTATKGPELKSGSDRRRSYRSARSGWPGLPYSAR